MKHDRILERLLAEAKSSPNTLGFLVFGSVALGTHTEKSDIDVITILREHEPASGLENKVIDGIKVGTVFFTYHVLTNSVNTVPYLLYIVCKAKLLFDRVNKIRPLLEKVRNYFADNPEIENRWNQYYIQFAEEKRQFGYEKTSLIDVLNELEKRYSGGEVKRTFFRHA